jgi:hypothetical protein
MFVVQALLVSAGLARAEEQGTGLEALEARVMALEDKLAASEATVAAQRELIGAQTPPVGEGNALDSFLSGLEFGGYVAGSYLYNFNNPDVNAASQTLCQFNCDHNQFTLDAVKLELGKAASEPGTAGFQIDLLFGEDASIFNSLTPDSSGRFVTTSGPPTVGPGDPNGVLQDPNHTHTFSVLVHEPSDSDIFVQEAYASYNWRGVELRLGKWETLLGNEVIDHHKNYNVTHGLLFTWAIPLFHTGVLAGGSLGESFGWKVGVTNGFNNSVDEGDNKGVLGQLTFTSGPISTGLSTYIGTPGGFGFTNLDGNTVEDDQTISQIYDWVLHFIPNDSLDTWVNVDYGRTDFDQVSVSAGKDEASWFGVATGFNYNLTEKLNFALRGEWFLDDNSSRLGGVIPGAEDITAISATGTLGYKLTDNLKARLELRHDIVDPDPDVNAFPKHDEAVPDEDQATYGIFELSYVFD